jgi:hypothetical protein
MRSPSSLLTRDRPLERGKRRRCSPCLKLAERPIRLVDRSRANRGIGADGQVADGEVVHPVGVRVRPCSKLEQSSATGDVSTSSSA